MMEASHIIANSFNPDPSASFENIFKERDPTYSLTEDAEELLSKIVYSSLETIIKGSSKLASHRNSENVGLHDVTLFLKTQFNMDPLAVADGYYYVSETSDEVETRQPPAKKTKLQKSKLLKSPVSGKTSETSKPKSKPKRKSKAKKEKKS